MKMKNFLKYSVVLLFLAMAVLGMVKIASEYGRNNSVEHRFSDESYYEHTQKNIKNSPKHKIPDVHTEIEKEPLRFAIAPVISPEESYVNYKKLVDWVGDSLGRRGQIMTRSSYSEINELIRENQCDVAMVCTFSYVEAQRKFGAELLAIPVVKGETVYYSYIVVNKESTVENIGDLKGKVLGYADDMSTSGWLYLAVYLKKQGLNPMKFFSQRVHTKSHDRSIRATAYGEVDAAAVDSIVFEHMPSEITQRLRVIHQSPSFGMPPLVVRADLDEKLKKQLQSILFSMHNDAQGQTILTALGIEKFVLTDDSMYKSVKALVDHWQRE